MSKPIHISYIWDKETYLKASEIAYKYELKHSPKRFLGWIFIAMTQFGVVQTMKGGAIGLLLLSSILVIYWYYFRWQIRKKLLLKNFDTSNNANHQFKIIADDEGLNIDNVNIKWSNILEVVSFDDGFLLYYNDTFIFFPTKAFESIEEKNRFASLAKSKVQNYKKEI